MAVSSAIGDLFKSFYEMFASLIGAFVKIFQTLINAIVGFFTSIFQLFADVLGGLADAAGGVGKFVISNIAIFAVIAIGGFLYVRSQQGKPLVPAKKTN